ncbi:MAG: NUDIX hydrolase [Candidatus Paceibacterota bacterium]|jgi:ADP-ribose pyrophosphatase YjhB (NUDIX family)
MNPLAIFKEKDVFPGKEMSEKNVIFGNRLTGKAIVFDNEGKVALVGNKVNSFYLLPGGGIDENESIENGVKRECLEEVGCQVDLLDIVGIIEDFRDRDKTHCINHCYTARIIGKKGELDLTEEEKKNGLHVIWVPLDEAISILEKEVEQLKKGEVTFYNTGFNILRDNLFLKEVLKTKNKMNKIVLFTDYRGQFYSSTKQRGAAVDLNRLKDYFEKLGFELVVRPFSEIDFRTQNYQEQWVLYQSSEDPGLFYRSYIDDLVLGLFFQGAKLIPSLFQFKAHHNKHFMEIARDLQDLPEIKNIQAKRYGTFEDYLKDMEAVKKEDFVLKTGSTSKSRGVFLLKNLREKIKIAKIASKTFSLKNLQYFIEWIKTGKKPLLISNYRQKFILQPYIEGLNGDYRVVIYNNKYYVLYRANRSNDFRASGSMKFKSDIELPPGLLDYTKRVFDNFDAPYMALDIGVKDSSFFLFEFQFLSFGQYTLEKSKFYYQLRSGNWDKINEIPDLEREIAGSVAAYIKRHQ